MKSVRADVDGWAGDYVHFKIARPVLGTHYERNVSFAELSSIVGRLSNLGLLTWRIGKRGRLHFRRRCSVAEQYSCAAQFIANHAGESYLRQPRHVA
jgi:hypothetical protein